MRGTAEDVVALVSKLLVTSLESNRKTLWLVSGGSNIDLQVEIMAKVAKSSSDKLHLLAIMPADERFGPAGHNDSNNAKLLRAGFDPRDAQLVDILSDNLNMEETRAKYDTTTQELFDSCDEIIALLGIGADGHTAGILPNSVATKTTNDFISAYVADDYKRLTMTAHALKYIDHAVVSAFGEAKMEAIKHICASDKNFEDMPAKLLWELPKVVLISDVIQGDNL